MTFSATTVRLAQERDVVVARQRARALAGLLGFDAQDQVRIATAVSEVARNALVHANGGAVEWAIENDGARQRLVIRVRDKGPGIKTDLDASPDSMGLVSARRMMDAVDIRTSPQGTVILLQKELPTSRAPLGQAELVRLADALVRHTIDDPFEEMRRQNRELADALDELRRRQQDLVELNRELEDTNRGVVALYAELDERAVQLQRADELKRRFLSNMSHEFRTPLHSVLALARLLLERIDGPLTTEQERQVRYVDQAARGLLDLVNDLLDLAKVEAGRIDLRPTEFTLSSVFGALRGMLRPLLVNERLELVFEDVEHDVQLYTDEGKLSQILRNLVANALKFTAVGEVRVVGRTIGSGRDARLVVQVSDTGIGIDEANFARIFEEFGQLDTPMHRAGQGTGLGLPLSLKLARLLGGDLTVESRVGIGSTFTLVVPVRCGTEEASIPADWTADPERVPILLVEDNPVDRFLVEKQLRETRYQVIAAGNLAEARAWLGRVHPAACILDVALRGEDVWSLVHELKRDPATSAIPLVLVTRSDERPRARDMGVDAYYSKPFDPIALIAELDQRTDGWSVPRTRAAR